MFYSLRLVVSTFTNVIGVQSDQQITILITNLPSE